MLVICTNNDHAQDRIRVAIYNLTGIIASDIGKPKDSDDEDSSDDEDETRDDGLLMFDFRADVSAPQNSNICERAAEIVWMEQQPVSDMVIKRIHNNLLYTIRTKNLST
jgi:hypothetical protein